MNVVFTASNGTVLHRETRLSGDVTEITYTFPQFSISDEGSYTCTLTADNLTIATAPDGVIRNFTGRETRVLFDLTAPSK